MDLEQMAREWLIDNVAYEHFLGSGRLMTAKGKRALDTDTKALLALLQRVCDETDEEWLGRKP